ncbi:MAG: hypothetical protein ACYTGV_12295 [Planctomycetota bacterium]|jgi:hypothetical protein
MIDPRCDLLSRILTDVVAELQVGADSERSWAEASRALEAAREEEDVELYVAIDERDFDTLRAIVRQWATGERVLVRPDRDVLKRALKAFRKRLKLVRLDSESSVGGGPESSVVVGPMSSGRQSDIVGVRPPDQYPQEVWDELVRQKRLIRAPDGVCELPPE